MLSPLRETRTECPTAIAEGQANYVPFIDGLRAVAILAVAACHAGLPGFSGGFVGVDVFFVISGFLIINQIKDGLEADRFSIVAFYARRILRILPPFLVMYVGVVALSLFILPTPNISLDFLRSVSLSPLMLVNFFFYMRQGYFDLDALEKPLLHTWSLSVEEQFYLVVPILLVALLHRRERYLRVGLVIALLASALSLAGAILETSTDGRNAAFYLTHLRAWEFVAGGLIGPALIPFTSRRSRATLEVAATTGFFLIVVAVIQFDSNTPYPSWRAILPVAGTFLELSPGFQDRAPFPSDCCP